MSKQSNAFFGAKLASAITLAGAAEGMLPSQDSSPDLFSSLKQDGIERLPVSSEKELVSKFLNRVANWLKHDKEDYMEIDEIDAMIAIFRAFTRYSANFGDDPLPSAMTEFGNFVRKEHPSWIKG